MGGDGCCFVLFCLSFVLKTKVEGVQVLLVWPDFFLINILFIVSWVGCGVVLFLLNLCVVEGGMSLQSRSNDKMYIVIG